ncbi:hypothetical protein ACJQWK_01588 [Exserohilum turcicum]|uniref:Uncharacterized protein n=1 Tax=Exserohilum turcicum (strain 28A) TaxID=671987 RepID=R0IVK7_EXST2|nr:uncharacterized protein SETTUDRAFT_27423 [Exserohilum turcica Et28A]EOA88621.1 hypothetical protein SETTUDRAFT_27423 [Exserohilum turcica Et28A]
MAGHMRLMRMQIAAAETESVRVFRQAGMDVVRPTKTWTVARGALRFQVENGPLKRLVHTSENRTATLPACLRMALALRTFPRCNTIGERPDWWKFVGDQIENDRQEHMRDMQCFLPIVMCG